MGNVQKKCFFFTKTPNHEAKSNCVEHWTEKKHYLKIVTVDKVFDSISCASLYLLVGYIMMVVGFFW